jgi:hypothetical protein
MTEKKSVGLSGSNYLIQGRGFVSREIYCSSEIIVVPAIKRPGDLKHIYSFQKPVEISIWKMLRKRTRMSKIIENIHDEYFASRARIEKDVNRFIKDLLMEGLVKEC